MIFKRGSKKLLPKPAAAIAIAAPEEPRLPSIFDQALNLGEALARNTASVIAGNSPIANAGVRAERLAICKTCSFYRESDERCAHTACGCFTKVKTALVAERCPATPPKW